MDQIFWIVNPRSDFGTSNNFFNFLFKWCFFQDETRMWQIFLKSALNIRLSSQNWLFSWNSNLKRGDKKILLMLNSGLYCIGGRNLWSMSALRHEFDTLKSLRFLQNWQISIWTFSFNELPANQSNQSHKLMHLKKDNFNSREKV